jgi:hypothetical protein
MTTVEAVSRAVARPGAVSLTVGGALLSLLLIGLALVTHTAGAPPVVWALLAAAALAVRPLAVAVHRRRRVEP